MPNICKGNVSRVKHAKVHQDFMMVYKAPSADHPMGSDEEILGVFSKKRGKAALKDVECAISVML